MTDIKKITIATGETSGENHALKLVRRLKGLKPHIKISAMGSNRFRDAGCEVALDADRAGVLGFTEVLPVLNYFYRGYSEMRRAIRDSDVLIAVDNFGFNLTLIRFAEMIGKPIFYFIPPKVWAWGLWRGRLLARFTDRIYTLFPFEVEELRKSGCDVKFFGNPLYSPEDIGERKRTIDDEITIALLPGSRMMEVENLLPVMINACEIVSSAMGSSNHKLEFVISRANGIKSGVIERLIEDSRITITVGEGLKPLEDAHLAIVASGTATLDTLIAGVPMVVIYRVSPITWAIGKALARTNFISLPNIIAGKEIVPEILQGDLTQRRLAREILNLLRDEDSVDIMMREYERVIERLSLGGDEVYGRIAEDIINYLEINGR